MSAGLPVVLRLAGAPVILIGEGEMVAAKRRLLERAGAVPCDESADARLAWIALEGAEADAAAARLKARGVLVNVADRPELCDFTMPAIVAREPVTVAIGTGGASAGLAAALRQRLEPVLPATLGALAQALEAARDGLRARYPDPAERRRALAAALAEDGPLDPLARYADGAVEAWLADAPPGATGLVTIRLRSGDPDALTLGEARALGQADRLFHRPDVPAAILDRARADAARLACPAAPAAPGTGLSVDIGWA